MDKIKVMVVGSQVFSRIGMCQVLAQVADFQVMEGEPNEELLETIDTKSPEVILLDMEFPSSSGFQLGKKIIRHHPYIKLIVLSPRPTDEELLEVTKAGATAYLNKSSSAEELVHTVRKVCRGEYPINDMVISKPDLAKIILKQFQDTLSLGKNMQTVAAPLTKREVEVLNLVSEGNSNKQVAGVLDTSEQTIKNYVSSILRKLNANDRTHAVVLAIRQGLIS